MRILAADIGNTTVRVSLVTEQSAAILARVSSRRQADLVLSDLDLQLREKLAGSPVDGAVVSSVVPTLTNPVGQLLRGAAAGRLLVVTSSTPLPVANGYASPGEVGVDRLANAVGGAARFSAPVIVVDAGTAVTIDVVSADRVFLGGAILPGGDLWAESLARFTAALPRVELRAPESAVGTTTEENIRSGIVHGLAGAIDRLVELAREVTGPSTPAVLTGGGAPLIAALCRTITHHDPHLTLHGLREIYLHNKSRG